MADSRSELERALADAGAQAVREWSARLRALLDAELERGLSELDQPRTGYDSPIVIAVAPRDGGVLAALPVVKELRADSGAVGDRAAALAIAVVEQVVEGASPGPPRAAQDLRLELGSLGEVLVLSYPAASPLEAAEYAEEGLNTEFETRRIDRLRARALLVPGHVLDGADDLRAPIGPTHPLRVAEAVTRLGASPLDEEAVDLLEAQLLQLSSRPVQWPARTRIPTRPGGSRGASSSASTGWASGAATTPPSITWRVASRARARTSLRGG